jgi:solute carrier family 25 protein 16
MPERIFANYEAQLPTTSSDRAQSSNMTSVHAPATAPARRTAREPSICPTDDEVRVPKKEESRRLKTDKKSWEYIVKSGIAGGMAGCAVGITSNFE